MYMMDQRKYYIISVQNKKLSLNGRNLYVTGRSEEVCETTKPTKGLNTKDTMNKNTEY